jgi:hypothetical protein
MASTIVIPVNNLVGSQAALDATISVAGQAKADIESLQAGTTGSVVHLTIDIPLATLQAKTSGAAFNIGSALPTNAVILGPVSVNVIQVLAGGSVGAAHITIQNTGETAGALVASTNVFTGVTPGYFVTAGSNPFPIRGGQQLQATVTLTVDTMAHLTTGHLAVDIFYTVLA